MLPTANMDCKSRAEWEYEEIFKMGGAQTSSPSLLSMSIARKKHNRRRSMSQKREKSYPEEYGSTLAELIGTSYRLSGVHSTYDESSDRILDSPRSATSASTWDGDRAQRRILELRNRNYELQAYSATQNSRIAELKSKNEDLQEELDTKEEQRLEALNCTALAEKKIVSLEMDNLKMSVEIENLQQVIQDLEERLQAVNLKEPGESPATRMLMNFENGNDMIIRDKDEQIWAFQQKINDLNREVIEKQMEVKQLTQQLHIKDLNLMELESAIDETSRWKTNVEDKLDAASRVMCNLKQQTTELEDTAKDRDSKLISLEQLLAAEKEAARAARVEKDRVMEKLQEFRTQKDIQDETCIDLYDELVPTINAQLIEDEAERYWSEGCQVDDTTEIEGYCHLEFNRNHRRTSSKKSKPLRAPPPIPTRKSASISSCKGGSETKPSNQADYEYFRMSSIAVRMNLEALFKTNEIMAFDVEKLWRVSRDSQVPMNTYYFYIERQMRKEFNLPAIHCWHTMGNQTPDITQGCCSLM